MLEGYRKQVAKVEAAKKPPEEATKTLAEILKDPAASSLFGGLMGKDAGGKALAERLAQGNLQQADFGLLEEARVDYLEKSKQLEKLDGAITNESVADFARGSEKFQQLLNLVGPEKAAKSIKNQLRDMIVNDPTRFESMSTSLETLIKHKEGDYAETGKKVIEHGEKLGVNEQDLTEALSIENETERKQKLAEKVRESYGFFKKIKDSIRGRKYSKADALELSKRKAELDAVVQTLESHSKDVGEALELASDGNDDLRKALTNELVGNKNPKQAGEASFMEAKSAPAPKNEEIDTAWESYKTAEKATNFSTLDAVKQKELRDAFIKNLVEKRKQETKKSGFWSNILVSIFEKFIQGKDLK